MDNTEMGSALNGHNADNVEKRAFKTKVYDITV
jgi:hypothetical protein